MKEALSLKMEELKTARNRSVNRSVLPLGGVLSFFWGGFGPTPLVLGGTLEDSWVVPLMYSLPYSSTWFV